MSLNDKILELLNREELTVARLAEEFGVTRNAIVVQLAKLESAGLVERTEPGRVGHVGKPPSVYKATPGNEDRNSHAYQPFSELLSRSMAGRLKRSQRLLLYRDIGEAMAAEIDPSNLDTLDARVAAVRRVADGLGAATQLEKRDKTYIIRSYTCPIASVVRNDPCACASLEAFFSKVTGCPVREVCSRDGKLVCQFEIDG